MCIMGNDFLPRPEALDLDGRGMDRLFSAYRLAESEYEWALRQAEEADATDREASLLSAEAAATVISRATGVASDRNFPDGCAGLAWAPLVAVGREVVAGTAPGAAVVGTKWLCRLLWEAAHDFERSDLSSITDGISAAGKALKGEPGRSRRGSTGRRASVTAGDDDDDDDDDSMSWGGGSAGGLSARSSAFDLSDFVGAGGAMGQFKVRSVASGRGESAGGEVESDMGSLAVVDVIRATWESLSGPYSGGVEPDSEFDGWSRGEWYQQHMSGCGPLVHVRAIASGAGGEAASGKRGFGPYPASGGPGLLLAADAATGGGAAAAERFAECAAADAMAAACESWLAGVAFVCSYYLVGLPSWGYRYPFAHSPMLTDAAAWAVSDGGLYGVRDTGAPVAAADAAGADAAESGPIFPARLAEVWTGADGFEAPVVRLCVPVGSPLSAPAHGIAVITPYSLHLLPSSLQRAMRAMLPWAPQTSALALLAAAGKTTHAADSAATAAGFASAAELPAELVAGARGAVGAEESSQAWWFPAWDDIRQDTEKAHAEWQVKLWVPMVGTAWALSCADWWEGAAAAGGVPAMEIEAASHALPTATDVWE